MRTLQVIAITLGISAAPVLSGPVLTALLVISGAIVVMLSIVEWTCRPTPSRRRSRRADRAPYPT